jgi:S-adenosylmethionine:tRNA ribosyltransferase-isomerase
MFMNINDFDYTLPQALIAHYPTENRSDSRLLVADPNQSFIVDSHFRDLTDFIQADDLLVFNDTRVMPARLQAEKPTGGKVEILIERILVQHQGLVHLGSNKPLKVGQVLSLADGSTVTIIDRQGRFFIVQFACDKPLLDRLYAIGHMPLPPYLKRPDEQADETRYQTVYSRHDGSVAAPTAGLHFDQRLLDRLAEKKIDCAYLTLHVGAGTFMPVQVENIAEHVMHQESFTINADTCAKIQACKARGGRVIAVGTTSLRCLESIAQRGALTAQSGETNLFITPGFAFQVADALITNFHLPKSTLLMLVSAFVGTDFCKKVYAHAIAACYRFYSYGDGSLLIRKK